MQVASVPLRLVSTQASLTSRSIRLAKPPFQKPIAVIVIVNLACLKIARNGGRGRMHEQIELYEHMPPAHFCLKSSV